MDNAKILAAIDEQIGRLEEAKRLLGGGSSSGSNGRKTGKSRRKMTAAARRKISLAQKARWAKQKKAV
jgi:hypothetical protein